MLFVFVEIKRFAFYILKFKQCLIKNTGIVLNMDLAEVICAFPPLV